MNKYNVELEYNGIVVEVNVEASDEQEARELAREEFNNNVIVTAKLEETDYSEED